MLSNNIRFIQEIKFCQHWVGFWNLYLQRYIWRDSESTYLCEDTMRDTTSSNGPARPWTQLVSPQIEPPCCCPGECCTLGTHGGWNWHPQAAVTDVQATNPRFGQHGHNWSSTNLSIAGTDRPTGYWSKTFLDRSITLCIFTFANFSFAASRLVVVLNNLPLALMCSFWSCMMLLSTTSFCCPKFSIF
jgi:hypothetical protein